MNLQPLQQFGLSSDSSQHYHGYGTKYTRMNQVKCFKGCLPQISLGPFFNTLSHIMGWWWPYNGMMMITKTWSWQWFTSQSRIEVESLAIKPKLFNSKPTYYKTLYNTLTVFQLVALFPFPSWTEINYYHQKLNV